MTYGFYVFLLAVFAVNVNVLSFDSGNQDSSTIELTDSFISSPEAVASGSGFQCSCDPGWNGWFWNNDRCLASNGGNQCRLDGFEDCQVMNTNCQTN